MKMKLELYKKGLKNYWEARSQLAGSCCLFTISRCLLTRPFIAFFNVLFLWKILHEMKKILVDVTMKLFSARQVQIQVEPYGDNWKTWYKSSVKYYRLPSLSFYKNQIEQVLWKEKIPKAWNKKRQKLFAGNFTPFMPGFWPLVGNRFTIA